MRKVFSLCFNSFAYIGEKKENCTSIPTENTLALLLPNHFVLDDCPVMSDLIMTDTYFLFVDRDKQREKAGRFQGVCLRYKWNRELENNVAVLQLP